MGRHTRQHSLHQAPHCRATAVSRQRAPQFAAAPWARTMLAARLVISPAERQAQGLAPRPGSEGAARVGSSGSQARRPEVFRQHPNRGIWRPKWSPDPEMRCQCPWRSHVHDFAPKHEVLLRASLCICFFDRLSETVKNGGKQHAVSFTAVVRTRPSSSSPSLERTRRAFLVYV